MGSDEFVFGLPGNPGFKKEDQTIEFDRRFPMVSLNDYDRIFGESIRTWERDVRCGFIILYRRQHKKYNHDVSLGLIAVEDAKVKFR